MSQYLLSIYQPEGDPPPPDDLESIMQDVDAVDEEMKAAGVWVFAGGLHAPSKAVVVRMASDDALITDGPYIESKEYIGGFWIIETPDRDAAVEWARKAARATTLPIEVREFQEQAGS